MIDVDRDLREAGAQWRAEQPPVLLASARVQSHRARRTRRESRPLVAIAVVLVVLAVATGALVLIRDEGDNTVTTRPVGGATGDGNSGAIPPGEYFYVRITGFGSRTLADGGAAYTFAVYSTHESWVGSDGSGRIRTTYRGGRFLTPENEAAFYDAGLTTDDLHEPSDRDDRLGPGEIPYVDLSTLPVDEAPLRATLEERFGLVPGAPDYAAQLLEWISDWGWLMDGPTENKQALVSVLGTSPGMTVEPQGESTVVGAEKDGVRTEFWFDDASGDLRRKRKVISDQTIASGLRAPNGTVIQDTTLEQATLVPSLDSTPAETATTAPPETPSTTPPVATQPCVLAADPDNLYALAQPATITLPDGRTAAIVPGDPNTEPRGVTLDSDGVAYPGRASTRAAGLWGASTDGGPFAGLDAAAVGDRITLHQAAPGSECTQQWRIVRISTPPGTPTTEPVLLRLVGFAPSQGGGGPVVWFYVDAVPDV